MEDKLLGSSKEDEVDLKLNIWVEFKKFWTLACPAIILRLTSVGILVEAILYGTYWADGVVMHDFPKI
ncbi:hypothetical protein FRX31_027491 [Thalictrum thalictroides]|uniref:Uncharacterized protein n=1 Tax=Thalictrum thalictroides TaxID=46969 RepID=A0A7J6VDE4_THATH|nr:hypothetical protein FRX31_027491 [Thalictrum thalictroides]